MNKPTTPVTPVSPAPAAPVLADQKTDFTAEGAPPPGVVGPAVPAVEPPARRVRRRRGATDRVKS